MLGECGGMEINIGLDGFLKLHVATCLNYAIVVQTGCSDGVHSWKF